MAEIKAIETHYNGNRFRSRLEARWAVFFDTMGIEYLYEPEGFKMQDGTCYLPDFYLPKMNEFFEVKGKLKLTDMHKIDTFVKEYKRPVVIGYDDFTFSSCGLFLDNDGFVVFERELKEESVLARCKKCDELFFTGVNGGWECLCCGYYDSKHTSDWIATGIHGNPYLIVHHGRDETKFKLAVSKAKQARFEHGECG